MNPTVIAVGLGLIVGALIWVANRDASGNVPGPGSPFVIENAIRYWQNGMKGQLLALLSASKLAPHEQVERTWVLGKTGDSALRLVREIQAKGNLAVTTVNLLDDKAPLRLIGSVLPTEVDTLVKGRDVAVLPKL